MIERSTTKPLNDREKAQVSCDLQLISSLAETGSDLGYRVVIAGGYAVDGALGLITRPHDDLDIHLYGQESSAQDALHPLLDSLQLPFRTHLADRGRKEFFHYFQLLTSDVFVEFYYIQTVDDPFLAEKRVVKSDGTPTPTQSFDTQRVSLEGHTFEIQNPLTELLDKMYKRELRGDPKKEKHQQDLENLARIIPQETIDKAWEKIKKNGKPY